MMVRYLYLSFGENGVIVRRLQTHRARGCEPQTCYWV